MKNNWFIKKINKELTVTRKRNWFINFIAWSKLNIGIWISLFFFLCSIAVAIVYAVLFYTDSIDPEKGEKLSKAWEISLPITALIFGAFLALWVIGENYRNIIKDFQSDAETNQMFSDNSDNIINEIEDINRNINTWKVPHIWAEVNDLYIKWQTYSMTKNRQTNNVFNNFNNNSLLTDNWTKRINEGHSKCIEYYGEVDGDEIYNLSTKFIWETCFNDENLHNEIEYIINGLKEIELSISGKNEYTEFLVNYLLSIYIQSKGAKYLYKIIYDNIINFREETQKTNDKVNEIISYCSKHKHKKKFCWTSLYAIKHIEEIDI